jgi:hypothetical protein
VGQIFWLTGEHQMRALKHGGGLVSTVKQVLAGYAFDGLIFQRAAVNRSHEVVNKETGAPLAIDPAFLFWYTRREFQNAIAYCQAKGQMKNDLSLVSVAPTPALMARLKTTGHLRTTEQHILHLLTAGRERVLGVRFTDVEIAQYTKMATAMMGELEKAYGKRIQISA